MYAMVYLSGELLYICVCFVCVWGVCGVCMCVCYVRQIPFDQGSHQLNKKFGRNATFKMGTNCHKRMWHLLCHIMCYFCEAMVRERISTASWVKRSHQLLLHYRPLVDWVWGLPQVSSANPGHLANAHLANGHLANGHLAKECMGGGHLANRQF